MASNKRQDYLTTAAGATGIGSARALSHHALEDAYNKGKRPKIAAERKFLHTPKGRGKFLAATGLLLASAPPFAVGLNNVITRKKEPLVKRDNVFSETQHGVTDSLAQRSALWKDPAPIHRQAQNYGVSTLIAGAGGGASGLALRKAKLGGGKKAAITGLAAATAGVASLPAQDKLMQRTSHNAYRVTPTGVSRGRKKPIRASAKADRVTRQDGHEIPSRFGKADWNWRPAPPRMDGGITKIPRSRLRTNASVPGFTYAEVRRPGGTFTPAGGLNYSKNGTITSIGVQEGYRRRGVAGHLLDATERSEFTNGIHHDTNRSSDGDKWAHAMGKKRGVVPAESKRESRIKDAGRRPYRAGRRSAKINGSAVTVRATEGRTGLALQHANTRTIAANLKRIRLSKAMSPEQIKAARALLLRQMPPPVKAKSLFADPLNKKPLYERRVSKLDAGYRGDNMSRSHKRALVMGAASIPIVPFAGDIAAASTAASLAPPELRKKTAALQFGGAQAGGIAGGAAGAYGLAAAAKNPKVASGIKSVSDKATKAKTGLRSMLGIAPKVPKVGPSVMERAAAKSPKIAGKVMKPLLANPKTALAGAAIGAFAGGQAGGWAGYGHALNLEDQRNAVTKSRDTRHGSRVAKYAAPTAMNPREKRQLAHRKEQTAALSVAGSATGLSALGTTVAARALKTKNPKLSGKLKAASVPLLTAGAGFGGVNGLIYAAIQHKEARRKQETSKSYVPGLHSWMPVTDKGLSGIPAMGKVARAAQKIRLTPPGAPSANADTKALRLATGSNRKEAKESYQGLVSTGVHSRPTPPSAAGRKIWAGQTAPKGKTTNIEHHPELPASDRGRWAGFPEDDWGGDASFNGRGGGRIRINSQQSAKGQALALQHEQRHIAPNRNPRTTQLRMRDDFTNGREEGRADIHRPRGPQHRIYDGTPKFRRGYEDVQRRISYSMAHGGGVGKSLVNGVGWRPITDKGLSGLPAMTKAQRKLHRYELEKPATGAKKRWRSVKRAVGFDSNRAMHEDLGVHQQMPGRSASQNGSRADYEQWHKLAHPAPSVFKALRMPRAPRVAPLKASVPRRGGLVRTGSITRTRRGSI